MKPRLLDLFCGAGGCTKGYQRAGFYVVGVDLAPQPNYCGDEFFQLDAMELLGGPHEDLDGVAPVAPSKLGDGALPGGVEGCVLPVVDKASADADAEHDSGGIHAASLEVVANPEDNDCRPPDVKSFDAISASPPCQAYSALSWHPQNRELEHPDLVGPTRAALVAAGLPYVIENVVGAPLCDPVTICGASLGLDVKRHRLFETSFPLMVPPCACGGWREKKFDVFRHGETIRTATVPVYGTGGGKAAEHWAAAMGIDWMDRKEMAQAIPPAYTEHIGSYLLAHLDAERKQAA